MVGRQIVEDKSIDYEVDEDRIREMTTASGGASKLLQPDLYIGVPTDRDVAPGVNAPLLQVWFYRTRELATPLLILSARIAYTI